MPLVQNATIVQVTGSTATTHNVTLNGVANGNALVGMASVYNESAGWTITSVADGGNTWVHRQCEAETSAIIARGSVPYSIGVVGGNRTLTWTFSAAVGVYAGFGLAEFTPVAAEDTFGGNNEIDTSGATDGNAGPITTTDAGALLVGLCASRSTNSALAYASPTSWTNVYRQDNSSSNQGLDFGYWYPGAVQTSYTAQWSHANAAGEEACAVVIALTSVVPVPTPGPAVPLDLLMLASTVEEPEGNFDEVNIRTWW